MKNKVQPSESAHERLYHSIKRIIEESRAIVSRVANSAMVRAYWEIGKLIVESEQQGRQKAKYGKHQLDEIAQRLRREFGRGFDASNLRNMRKFYLTFPICDALRHKLSWTHFRLLMRINDPIAREWYANESVAQSWSSRILDRQMCKPF